MSIPTFSPTSQRRLPLAIALLFAATSVITLATPALTLAWDVDTFSSTSESQLVALTNQARASAGLKALKVDSTLRSVARWRSKDMIDRNYFSHDIPGYGKVWDKLNAIGYCYIVAGENIGWNNYPDDLATAAIQQSFMNSPGHRANILGKAWDVIGIGAYKGPTGKKMWTVLFADKCGATSTAPNPTPKPTPKPRPKATPRPTQRPAAARATTPPPTPTPVPTVGPEATPIAAPSGLLDTNGVTPPTDQPSDTPESSDVPTAPDAAPAGLRVVDRTSTDGLLGTIVGGVAGFFFGG